MTLKLREGVSLAQTEYGIAVLDETSGEYFNLNPTGALVLQNLLDGKSDDEAAEALAAEYDVDGETAREDVRELVSQLESTGLTERR